MSATMVVAALSLGRAILLVLSVCFPLGYRFSGSPRLYARWSRNGRKVMSVRNLRSACVTMNFERSRVLTLGTTIY